VRVQENTPRAHVPENLKPLIMWLKNKTGNPPVRIFTKIKIRFAPGGKSKIKQHKPSLEQWLETALHRRAPATRIKARVRTHERMNWRSDWVPGTRPGTVTNCGGKGKPGLETVSRTRTDWAVVAESSTAFARFAGGQEHAQRHKMKTDEEEIERKSEFVVHELPQSRETWRRWLWEVDKTREREENQDQQKREKQAADN
jgi:hypothetical protein